MHTFYNSYKALFIVDTICTLIIKQIIKGKTILPEFTGNGTESIYFQPAGYFRWICFKDSTDI